MSRARRIEPLLVIPLLLAIGLRLWGLDWGLPAVYEEAYPFKKAWEMWGFGPRAGFDLNPHFFNYPTFFFYVQFLGQGLLYLLLKLSGQITSTLDFRVLYELDKTSFYLLGRGIAAAFGVATVAATFALARSVAGLWAGGIAALAVALNQTHITKSQAIEVDVPMTLLATLCIFFALRIAQRGHWHDYVWAGLCGGLALSTKYNGALLGLVILAGHLIAVTRRPAMRAAPTRTSGRAGAPRVPPAPSLRLLLLAAGIFVGVFLLTSPYILLDRQNAWLGFNYERQHMKIGHFGLDDTPAFLWYMRVLARSLLGWPLALCSLAGLVWFIWQRKTWAIVLAIFPLTYIAILSSWSMKAERYMIPVLPLAATFAAAFVCHWVERLRPRGATAPALAAALAAIVLVIPSVVNAIRERARLRGDTRTLARQWIEQNIPAGSFVVVEPYGPELLGVIEMRQWSDDVRQRILDRQPDMRSYAVMVMPMYQVHSQNSGIFYDLSHFDRIADVIVTSSSVGSRYRKDPVLYAPQVAFYDSLALRWEKRQEFGPDDGSGPRIAVYTNPAHAVPFAHRRPMPRPPPLRLARDLLPGAFSAYFERLGYDYEAYSHYDAAIASYVMGLRYEQPPDARRGLFMGAVRNSLRAGSAEQALHWLDEAERALPEHAAIWRRAREQILKRVTPADSAAVP